VSVVQSLPSDEVSDDPTPPGSIVVKIDQAVGSDDLGEPDNYAVVATASVVIVIWIDCHIWKQCGITVPQSEAD
jgi:hypothetical protein